MRSLAFPKKKTCHTIVSCTKCSTQVYFQLTTYMK